MMRRITLVLVLTGFALLAGCSQLRSTQRLDLAPFAEYTVNLAADIEYGLTKGARVRYLQDYRGDPEVVANNEQWNRVRTLLRSVVAYSVEITTLGNSQLSERGRNEELAKFLDRLVRPVMQDNPDLLHISEARLDTILVDIKDQQKFLDALGSAQPLIDESARIAELIFDDLQDSLDETADHLRRRIEADSADVRRVRGLILEGQARIFESLILLGRYRGGDESALEQLTANEPETAELMSTTGKLTLAEIQQLEERLLYKLDTGANMKDLITPDLEYYRNQVSELDELYTNSMLHLKKARVTVMVWARAHRDLAHGITDPANIDIFDITKKAVNTVL